MRDAGGDVIGTMRLPELAPLMFGAILAEWTEKLIKVLAKLECFFQIQLVS